MDPDERHDDFDEPAPREDEQDAKTARVARTDRVRATRATLQERAAAHALYPRAGLVQAAPINPPAGRGDADRPLTRPQLSAPTHSQRRPDLPDCG